MSQFADNFHGSENLDLGNGADIFESLVSKASQFAGTAFETGTPVFTSDSTLETGVFTDPNFPDTTDDSDILASLTASSTSTTTSITTPAPSVIASTTSKDPLSALFSTLSAAANPTVVAASETPSGTSDGSTASKSGVSSAAIGVTVTIFILIACGASFFLIRRKYLAKRANRRNTWNAPGMSPTGQRGGNFAGGDIEAGSPTDDFEEIDIDEKQEAVPLPAHVTYNNLPPMQVALPSPPPPLHPTGFAPPRLPSPPPVAVAMPEQPAPIGMGSPSFGNAAAPLVPSTMFSAATGSYAGEIVVVARTFVPTLPDELSIQHGEQVRVIGRFDDGWAHVERLRSGAGAESGVVPLECLEPIAAGPVPHMGLSQEAVEGWRLSKRKSSLAPAGPAMY